MKTKRSGNKLVVRLNKQTIANLNRVEMRKVGGGGNLQGDEYYLETQNPAVCRQPTPVPTDGGITPLLSDLFNCN
jgi:hypothetical protein